MVLHAAHYRYGIYGVYPGAARALIDPRSIEGCPEIYGRSRGFSERERVPVAIIAVPGCTLNLNRMRSQCRGRSRRTFLDWIQSISSVISVSRSCQHPRFCLHAYTLLSTDPAAAALGVWSIKNQLVRLPTGRIMTLRHRFALGASSELICLAVNQANISAVSESCRSLPIRVRCLRAALLRWSLSGQLNDS